MECASKFTSGHSEKKHNNVLHKFNSNLPIVKPRDKVVNISTVQMNGEEKIVFRRPRLL
jgi:hypothetical protein